MNRDAKGRFCKKAEEGKATKTTKAKKTVSLKDILKNDCTKRTKLENDIEAILLKLAATLEENGLNVQKISCAHTTDPEEVAKEIDKIFSCTGICTGDEIPVEGAEVVTDDFPNGFLSSLISAKAKINEKQKQEVTPIDWKKADPIWISDLHEIYEEGCIPGTEEELRLDIEVEIDELRALVTGYMDYLKNKGTTCKCKGKCRK